MSLVEAVPVVAENVELAIDEPAVRPRKIGEGLLLADFHYVGCRSLGERLRLFRRGRAGLCGSGPQRQKRQQHSNGNHALSHRMATSRKFVLCNRPPPEIAMILASGRSRRISMIVSMPSFSGMMRSVMTRSGWTRWNIRMPSTPSFAVVTS